MGEENPWHRRGREARRLNKALSVPAVFLGGPLAGAGLGWLAGRWLGSPDLWMLAGILLGFAAAIWELVRMLRDGGGE